MNIFDSIDILAGGLSAERVRMDVTTSNMANAHSTRSAEGGPYKRRDPVFSAENVSTANFPSDLDDALQTVSVDSVTQDSSPPRQVFDPNHPDANPNGYVAMPNINIVEEMVNMMTASRSYEAGITAMHGLVDMAEKALSLGR